MKSMNCECWKQAITSELGTLRKLDVYDLVDKSRELPLKKAKCSLLQKTPEGSISQHKASYASKGFSQVVKTAPKLSYTLCHFRKYVYYWH